MILDTSAVVAVLYRESEAAAFAQLIHDAEVCRISVVSHVELSMVIEQQLGPDGFCGIFTAKTWFERGTHLSLGQSRSTKGQPPTKSFRSVTIPNPIC